jgi:RimJ/RimL family protein N-acetyltransferase
MVNLPEFETDRLNARHVGSGDAAEFHAVEADQEVKRHLKGATALNVTETLAKLHSYRDRLKAGTLNFQCFAIRLKNSGVYIGRCGVHPFGIGWDINIVLDHAYHRNGYSFEIGRGLLRVAFESLRCEELFGKVDPANIESIGLCRKLGMKPRPELEPDCCHFGEQLYSIKRMSDEISP